jgi:hypothetical protein
MSVVPRVSFTDPVGTPVNWGVTVIVNVTDPPKFDGFGNELSAVVLAAFVIVWEIAGDVLAAYLVSPLYVTVMDFIPTANVLVESVAVPPLNVRLPSIKVPALNVAAPVAVPLSEVTTFAVKVMVCP